MRYVATSTRIRMLAVALLSGLLSVLLLPAAARGETAAEAAKRPVQGPKPARLPDGRPNWTGFWVPEVGLLQMDVGLGGTPAVPGPMAKRVAPFSQYSALKSPYKERLAAAQAEAAAGRVADPVATCFPPGMPRMMGMIYGMELLQTPGQIAITSEWQAASRRIWLNQKAHTPADELDDKYTGESIGHWEGDTLIVDTVGVRLDVPLNFQSLPHSSKLHIVEKFYQKSPGILVDEILIDDPDVFVAPWTEIQTYRYRPDLRIEEYVCLENNRNVGTHGEAVFK